MRSLKVFLCHSSDDKDAIRGLYHRLSGDGYSPWLDEENLLPGQEWEDEIPRAVRQSDIVIVCLSPRSISKTGYVQKEIKFALDVADQQPQGTIFIIPLKLEPCDVPGRLVRWHWVNLFEEKGYEKLKRALLHRATTGNLAAEASVAGFPISRQPIDEREKPITDVVETTINEHDIKRVLELQAKSPPETLRNPISIRSGKDLSDQVEERFLAGGLKAYRSVSNIASWLFGIAAVALLLLVIFGNIPIERVPIVRFGLASIASLFSLFFIGGVLLKGTLSGLVTAGLVGLCLFAVVRFSYPPPSMEAVSLPIPTLTPSVAVADASPGAASVSPSVTPRASPSPSPSPSRPTPRRIQQQKGFSIGSKVKSGLKKILRNPN
ncbi:MAG: toll/interleukin-1 receptor domain-containing protein [Pyrinomonadaceae bacterium]|nr:toll/interleukin-1 receptor domain-containing protein [Pyrinomonadaceae bacterium]